MNTRSNKRETGILVLMLLAISIAFGWLLWPFLGAILWAVLLAIIFTPWYQTLLARTPGWRNVASGTTVLLIALLVILPLTLIASALTQEVSGVVEHIQSGQFDVQRLLADFRASLPAWAANWLTHFELTGLPSLWEKLSAALAQGWQVIAQQVLSLGQLTGGFLLEVFIALYLLFYLLRDGGTLLSYVRRGIPLPPEQQQVLLDRFTATVRSVLKGNLVVALVQGTLGGLIFWALGIGTPILWGTLMAVLSLLPLVGCGLVWAPAAIYLLLTGSVTKGVVLLIFGTLVISTIDNALRPLLVGTDVKMPSYVVLVSSLGGIALFGFNGFVIGPLLAVLFLTAWEMYLQVRAQEDTASD
jgi:predicted PurR-regulated permease PerM